MDFPTGGMHDPAGEPPRPDAGTGRVSHDMESIFGPGALSAKGQAPSQCRAIVPIATASPARRTGRTLAVSGLAILGAVALSLGLAFGLERSDRPAPTLAPAPAPTPPAMIARPAPGVAQVQPRPAVTPPPAEPAPQTAAIDDRATEPSMATSRPARAAVSDHPQRKATSPDTVQRVTRTVRPQDDMPCGRVARRNLAWCMRPQLVAADRQLRWAYERAAHAGVGRRTIIAYRQRWLQLRSRANRDPRGVAAGYRQIARQLDAARTGRY